MVFSAYVRVAFLATLCAISIVSCKSRGASEGQLEAMEDADGVPGNRRSETSRTGVVFKNCSKDEVASFLLNAGISSRSCKQQACMKTAMSKEQAGDFIACMRRFNLAKTAEEKCANAARISKINEHFAQAVRNSEKALCLSKQFSGTVALTDDGKSEAGGQVYFIHVKNAKPDTTLILSVYGNSQAFVFNPKDHGVDINKQPWSNVAVFDFENE